MQALRFVMLLAALPVGYLLFFHPKSASQSLIDENNRLDSMLVKDGLTPVEKDRPAPVPHSQYKREMDQARDAARQMQAQKAEADAIP